LLDVIGLVAAADTCRRFEMNLASGNGLDIGKCGGRQRAAVRRRHIGYVLQTGGLLPFLNIRENVALVRRLNGLPAADGTVERLLEGLGIADQARKKPHFLSGGQRQRAAIARALAHDPGIILADEPTGAVDRLAGTGIVDLLLEQGRRRGAAVLLVTHDEALVRDRVSCVYRFAVSRVSATETRSRLEPGEFFE
jgi:putative ABC transport system ATP-binding protein